MFFQLFAAAIYILIQNLEILRSIILKCTIIIINLNYMSRRVKTLYGYLESERSFDHSLL